MSVCIIPGRCSSGSKKVIRNISTSSDWLSKTGQVEMVGGGFYEPILISIPPADQHEQITRLADYVEKHFGKTSRRFLAGRACLEPQLASILAEAASLTRCSMTFISSPLDSNPANSSLTTSPKIKAEQSASFQVKNRFAT